MKISYWIIVLLIAVTSCEKPSSETDIDCNTTRTGDVILYTHRTDEAIFIDIKSNLEEELSGQIQIELFDFSGNSIGNDTLNISLEPMEIINYLEVPLEDINLSSKNQNFMLAKFESEDGSQRSSDLLYFVDDSELELATEPEIDVDIQPIISGYKVRLRSLDLVKNVKLSFPVEGIWSDNCFDLLPGKLSEYYFSIPEYTPDLESQLTIDYLNKR